VADRIDSVRRYWGLVGFFVGAGIAFACTTDTAIGPDAALDSLYIEPASAVMVLDDTLHLTAVGVDSTGKRFADTRVTWRSGDPTIAVSANGSIIGTQVGSATVEARAGSISATAIVIVQPRPVMAFSPDSVTLSAFANGPDPAPVEVTISNGGGGTLTPGVDSIRYFAGTPGWLQATMVPGTGNDTLRLTASTGTLTVGSYSATVFLSAAKASARTLKVRLSMGVDAPATMAVDSGAAQTATVNTNVPVRPSVLVLDQYGNPVPGTAVTFSVTSGGGAVNPVASVVTDAAGRARVTSWTLGTAAGANTLQATSTGLTAVSFSATGTAGAPANAIKTAGDTQTVTVNAVVPVAPTLRVTDQFGNPVESVTVTFNVAAGGGGLSGATRKTDNNGQAVVGSWRLGTAAGANTLTATAASLSPATFSATGTPDVADSITLSGGNNQTDTVKATLAPYTVRVADQYGNGVPNKTVTWAVSGGGSITASSITNGSGIASATRVFGTAAGAQNATATVAGLIGSPVAFSATATHGAPTTIVKFAGDGQSAVAGTPVGNAPVARVVDQFGNPVAGIGVTFAVTAGGGSVSPTSAITTDTAGKAGVTSWTLGPGAGSNNDTLTATASGLPAARFVASGLSGAAKNLVYLSGNAQTDTIGATLAAYSVQVTDTNNNGVSGVTVSWTVTAGGGSITVSSITNGSGVATATRVLGTAAGVDSASASVGGLVGSPRKFGATALHGNPNQIVKTGDGQSATVNTSVATAPSVQVTDRAGNPIQGASVTFSVTGGGGATSPVSGTGQVTNASGVAQLTSWTLGTGAGANALTVTGALGASFSATGTPDAPSSSQSTVVDNATNMTACSVSCTFGGGTADSVTVTVRDQYGNLINGASVTVSASGSNNTFSPSASGTSNASGIFKTLLNSSTAQLKSINASATTGLGGGLISPPAAVTVDPDFSQLIANSTVGATSPITASSGSSTSSVTVTVQDQFSNPVSGRTVTLFVSGSGNSVSQPGLTTNASGVATGSFSSTVAQGKTVTASFTGTGGGTISPSSAAVTVNAAAATQVVMVTQPANWTSGTTSGSTQPAVRLQDTFSNNVLQSGVTVTASKASGTGTLSGTLSVLTNASGIATFTNLSVTGNLTGYGSHSFTFASGGVTSATSSTINVAVSHSYNIQSGIYNVSCTGCHAWTYANTVNQASSCASTPTLITPSSTANSHIYRKLTNTQACGGFMPPSGTNATFADILLRWINAGSPNN
jgi:adhesin/invasin